MFRHFLNKHKVSFQIPICVEKDGKEYYAYCPALKGVHVDGSTKEEAIENVKIACALYIKSLIKHNESIPLQIINLSPKKATTKSTCSYSSAPQFEQVFVRI